MENKIRAFIAIELDAENKTTIESFAASVKAKAPSGLRWVKADLLHLTLKFLGDITPIQVEQTSRAISRVIIDYHPFTLQFAGTGAFPNWRNPRTLWMGINKNETLTSLFRQLDAELTLLGFLAEVKPFSPHLTLCRVSDHFDPRLVQPLQKDFDAFSTTPLLPWKVHEVIFFKSLIQPGGPIYTPISKHGLK
ncbi:MAG: RNA 2',3'-cyclic phosphodiesterase [Chloroflexi bacterium HGW-Chloroflexi-5]|jgi:2'-5' RNA ligase|nr:MAG: RNA 2',3'-cyclic phosphodiesterase [Chloroflexi bacterium HGW-Chloroflexi-5]